MPNRIQHKRNATPGAIPAANALEAGELAVNTADGVIYLKRDNGTVVASGAALSHAHSASDLTSGTVAAARLGSGSADSSTYLRGDGTWASVIQTSIDGGSATTFDGGVVDGGSATTV